MEKILERFNALRIQEKSILVAGLVLLVDGFLPWYSVDLGLVSFTASGWEAPGAIWSILAVLIGAAMAGVIIAKAFTDVKLPDNVGGMSWPKINLGAGAAVLGLLLLKLFLESSYISFGFYVGLLSAVVLAGSGLWLYREEEAGEQPAASDEGSSLPG